VPIFKYHCPSCGLRFGSLQPAKGAKDALACKRCGETADRKVSASSFKFAHRPDAPAPQNTGASSVDHDVDVVIGRAAEQNLREYQRRQDYKQRVITANDTTGDHLSRLDNGEYFVMTDQQRVAAKKARLQNQEATQRISEWMAERRKAESSEAASSESGR
jgi:putative FmdB family regulatory protein